MKKIYWKRKITVNLSSFWEMFELFLAFSGKLDGHTNNKTLWKRTRRNKYTLTQNVIGVTPRTQMRLLVTDGVATMSHHYCYLVGSRSRTKIIKRAFNSIFSSDKLRKTRDLGKSFLARAAVPLLSVCNKSLRVHFVSRRIVRISTILYIYIVSPLLRHLKSAIK